MSYNVILVAIDLAAESEYMLVKGKKIADCFSADLHCVYIVRPIEAYTNFGELLKLKDIQPKMYDVGKSRIDELSETFQVPPTNRHIITGYPKTDVVETARKIKADLIILGRHKENKLKQLLGSTAYAVVHSGYCDVQIINL